MMSVNLQETFREAAPLHFLFKIESFSLLSKNSIVKCESNEFETEGYKWKLSLYPDGNKNENGNNHISLYLVLVGTSSESTSLPKSKEMNVLFRLFLFDHIRDRYLIREDTEGRTRRFHEIKKVWGFPQFVSLAKLNDLANGYLVDDTCVFGAEVFIAKPTVNIDCLTALTIVKQAATVNYTWKIENFSNLKEGSLQSENFKAGGHNWVLIIHPKGDSVSPTDRISKMSLYLILLDCLKVSGLKVYANFTLRLRDQINSKHFERSSDNWFSSSEKSWGWTKFIGLSKMNDKGKGYLVNDTCSIEAEVKVLGVVSERP